MTNRSASEANKAGSGLDQTIEAILESGALGQSERRARLLRYLVDLEVSGNGDRTKAYSIAIDVLGRDESFDPGSDSIVRVEIARLRDGLRLFYGEKRDPGLWLIDIPKGTYRPTLTPPDAARTKKKYRLRPALFVAALLALAVTFLAWRMTTAPRPDATAPYPVLRIAVMPFDASGDHPNMDHVAFGLYSELSLDLSAYPWIAVVSPLDPDRVGADYALKSELLWQGDMLRTNTQLISLPDERLVWSKAYEILTDVAEIQATQQQITSGIANSLGSENGISPDLIVAKNAREAKANLEGFICFISIYRYAVKPTRAEHLRLRDCLERTVKEYPEFGEAWAALGVLYMDEARYGRNPRPGRDAWADARKAIDRGLELAPLRNGPLLAALTLSVQAPVQDLARARTLGLKLMELFPRHPVTLVLIGSLLAEYLGQWSQGLELNSQALTLEHSPPSAFFLTPAYHAALQDDDAAALAATAPLTTTSENELLLRYLAAARNGLHAMMQENRALLAQKGLVSDEDLLSFVRNRRFHDALEDSLIHQLQAAFEIEEHSAD